MMLNTSGVNINGKLAGKVAIVTASTQGIGLSIAKRLSRDGATVVVSSRKQEHVDGAVSEIKAEGGNVYGMVCHVGKAADRTRLIQQTVARFGGIDILVSNAAVNPSIGPIFDTTEEAFDKIFDVNVKATFFLCKEVAPYMKKRGGGSIVIMSSIIGYNHGLYDNIGVYAVSKTALLGMVKALVPQCAKLDIRVNGIAPGGVRTNFTHFVQNDPEIQKKHFRYSFTKTRRARRDGWCGVLLGV